jgi:hypothetical protein
MRLEGISSRYWTPPDTWSQGLVSSGSSNLLPSASPRRPKGVAPTDDNSGQRTTLALIVYAVSGGMPVYWRTQIKRALGSDYPGAFFFASLPRA